MRTEVMRAYTIDGAVERIMEELKEDTGGTSSGRHNVIYFDGWDGLGASAVLREVGRRLAPSASGEKPAPAGDLEFSQIINLDCSKWESRRAMQRSLAEKLELPPPVMKMFDAQDEEDNYNGVDMGSRAEIPQVADAIYRQIQKQLNSRFLVIFNNGSCQEIDLESFGFPLSGYSRNKALWSFQGGFRLYPRTAVDNALESMKMTDVFLSVASDPDPAVSGFNLSTILHHEAEEIACKINFGGINWPAAATNCFLYMAKLCRMGSHLMDYDLATHSCNYWKCDGIIQLQHGTNDCDDDDDRVWLSCDALQHEMRLDVGYYQSLSLPSPVSHLPEQIPYWTSPTCGFMLILDRNGRIPNGMFLQYDKLRVLKLSACTFSFTSPPFLCCHSLRFLWLDHCRDESSSTDGVGMEEDIRQCFQKLWVLDMRYSSSGLLSAKMTDFMTQLRELDVTGQDIQNMDALHGQLHNIRRFRVTKSSCTTGRIDPAGLFSGKDKMELLDLSGNSGNMERLSVVSSCTSLETVIIDGSISLKDISLKGCAKLKNLLLSGLFPKLYSLDITGTAVKILDLRAVAAPLLNELFLLACGKLYAILWPPEEKRKRYLDKLHMDTTQKETDNNTFTALAAAKGRTPVEFDWYISASDERILGSLVPVKDYFDYNYAYVEISTTPSPTHRLHSDGHGDGDGGNKGSRMKSSSGQHGNLQRLKFNSIYADVAATFKEDTSKNQQAHEGDSDAWGNSLSFIQTRIPRPMEETLYHSSKQESLGCYMHIEEETIRSTLQAASRITVPGFICDGTNILHVQDRLSITSIFAAPLGSSWNKLEWCQVERCPKLECVFNAQLGEGPEGNRNGMEIFKKLKTIWVSHLLNALHVLEHIGSSQGPSWHRAFADLTLLHLYCCPRMVYGIPLRQKTMSLQSLETIEIMWCGDLNVAFHLLHDETPNNGAYEDICPRYLPRLKHIHLHELPRLRSIFSDLTTDRIIVHSLETIRIRGCWSLRKLPPFIYGSNTVCDCEKEWWDRTEEPTRDEMISYHCKFTHKRPRETTILVYNYKLTHPRYYKKTVLRASVFR